MENPLSIKARQQREKSIDRSVPRNGLEKSQRVDLGLALLSILAKPGVGLNQDDIAIWCGCSRGAIYLLEKRAMKKLRNKLLFGKASATGKELAA